jgi:hypothetical protein
VALSPLTVSATVPGNPVMVMASEVCCDDGATSRSEPNEPVEVGGGQGSVVHACEALGLAQFDCACPVLPSERLQFHVAVVCVPLVEEHGPEHEVQLVVFPVVKNHVRTVYHGDW